MVNHLLLETKQSHLCQRCGGQVLHSYDDISCLQCGAPHTREGKLVSTYSIQEFEALLARQEIRRPKAGTAQRSL